ncbi:MAG: hypothetical protein V4512_12405 [Pseudomonadota bacterium]
MTEHIRNIRPARAAIAAVLALSATPVLAQVAAPPTVAPTIAPAMPDTPAPTVGSPTAPAFAVSQPVVQQTASVEDRRAASIAAAEAEAATKAAAPVAPRVVRPRAVERMVAAVAAPVAATPVTPSPVVAPEPVVAPAPVMAEAAPAPVSQAVARTDDALLWAMGGSALLLLGLGGAAMARRRRPAEAIEERETFIEPPVAPVAVTPVAAAPVAVPVARPAFATAPSASHEDATLAAMVAAPPSEDNPFLTHAKRLRRARILLAQREAGHAPVMTQAQSQVQVATPAPAMDRSQTVYRFGGEGARPGLLRPRTS